MRLSKLVLIIFAMAFFAAGCDRDTQEAPTAPVMSTLFVGDHELKVEVASQASVREKGLSGRDSLPENSGMLFVFENPGKHGFWMKDMNFSLDFIWINDGKVTEITPHVPNQPGVPDQSLNVHLPANPIDSMLEVNAGFAAKNQIKVGDSVNLTSE